MRMTRNGSSSAHPLIFGQQCFCAVCGAAIEGAKAAEAVPHRGSHSDWRSPQNSDLSTVFELGFPFYLVFSCFYLVYRAEFLFKIIRIRHPIPSFSESIP